MKTKYMLGAATVAALHCMSANAQIFGGHATGALDGALGGGIGGVHDVGVMGHGSGHGAFSADLATDSLRRSARDVTSSATDRASSTVGTVRNRSESTIAATREQASKASAAVRGSADAGASAAMQTTQSAAMATRQLEGTASAAGSMASNAKLDASAVDGALDAAHEQQLDATDLQPRVDQSAASSLTSELTSKADAVQPPKAEVPKSESSPAQSASLDGALSKSVGTNVSGGNERMPLAATADGSAAGDGSVSKRGVSADGSTQGSANASFKR